MNTDGSNFTILTNNSALDSEPKWSPDGTKIAFHSSRDGNGEIYVMNADGSQTTRLTNNSSRDASPSWSPDGSQIVYATTTGISIMNANGSNPHQIYNHSLVGYPDWSPDGTKIVFSMDSGGQDLFTILINGTGLAPLTSNGGTLKEYEPHWSSDGNQLVFLQTTSINNGDIYKINKDGSNMTRLTNTDSYDGGPTW